MRLRNTASFIREFLLCLLSAGMLFLAFPYFNLWYLAWFAFVPFFLAIEDKPPVRVLLLSWLTGAMFWGGAVYWLIHVTLGGMIGMVLYLSLYFAAFGFAVSAFRAPFPGVRLLFVPAVWVILEYLRSHLLTGFPWALLGYTQASLPVVIQAADITGVWGVSFLIVMANTAAYGFLRRRGAGACSRLSPVIVTIGVLVLCAGYGIAKLGERPPNTARRTIAIVQGNVCHERKWQPDTRDAIMETHLRLSREAAVRADLVVWSEAALPVIIEDEPYYFERTRAAVRENKTPLLMGAISRRGERFFNSALLVMPSGDVAAVYDKIHRVPFGEYIPLRAVFPFLETLAPIGELARGDAYTVFSVPGPEGSGEFRFSTLICFEDAFPEMARRFVREGARCLVNITNDAWYRYSPAAYQHCQAAVFRAVENRVPVVRFADSGISCFIDRNGVISDIARDREGKELFTEALAVAAVTVSSGVPTVYTRYGDYFLWLCVLAVCAGAAVQFLKRR